MPILMYATAPGGRRNRSCDANCYGVRRVSMTKCTCVCGGINHGVGLSKARENTRALHGDSYWREKHKGIKFAEAQLRLALEVAKAN
jgi:hypothetical protein